MSAYQQIHYLSKEEADAKDLAEDCVGYWLVSYDADGKQYDEVGPYETHMEAESFMDPPREKFIFEEGDPVEKFTGDYVAPGEVVAAFHTKKGKARYVVEHTWPGGEGGFLHIYGAANLRMRKPGTGDEMARAEMVRQILVRVAKYAEYRLSNGAQPRSALEEIARLCAGEVPEWMREVEEKAAAMTPEELHRWRQDWVAG